jgi:PAS domain S-box-containing protein
MVPSADDRLDSPTHVLLTAERRAAAQAAILQAALDAILTIDHKGRIVEFNPAAERIFGHKRNDVLGRDMAGLLIPPRLRQQHYRGLAHYLTTGEGPVLGRRIEMPALRSDGVEFPIELAIVRIPGEPPLFTGYVRDLSAAKRAEVDAREASRRKDEFLSMLAHELRNPLAPILNSLHVARQPETSAADREQALILADRQARHLTHIVDDLLEVSRVMRGKVQLRPQRLDLGNLIQTTVEDRRFVAEQAGLSLAVKTPAKPVWVHGDGTRLSQVFQNLLDNAVRFTDRGGKVTVHLTVDERPQAVVTVGDSGIGIEPEMLPRLFDVFAQADRTLERTRGGLGLGLSVVKGLVDLHGGQVAAASKGPGRGAEFTVRLPLETKPTTLAATSAPSPASVKTAVPSREGLRVLVVEDQRDAAASLRMLLEVLGHETRVAYTGPDGVCAAAEWRPDIVLCDIGLPGLDGYGVARELRLNPITAQVRLLALTGYGTDEDRRLTREAGFDLHLTKPVAPETLQDVLAWRGA